MYVSPAKVQKGPQPGVRVITEKHRRVCQHSQQCLDESHWNCQLHASWQAYCIPSVLIADRLAGGLMQVDCTQAQPYLSSSLAGNACTRKFFPQPCRRSGCAFCRSLGHHATKQWMRAARWHTWLSLVVLLPSCGSLGSAAERLSGRWLWP